MRKKVSAGEELHPETGIEKTVSAQQCCSEEPSSAVLSDEAARQKTLIADLEAELARQKEQTEKFRDELLRRAAEFENFRKIKERESSQAGARALENTIRELLPLVDDLKRVLDNAPHILEITQEAKPYIDGVELLKRNFDKWLAGKGVTEIQSIGSKLDVHFHEAISMIDVPGTEPETVVEEYQTGYLLGDKVIRHARVIVAK
jgi:molecular chaperone GrpE